MADQRPHTKVYPEQARKQLGLALTRAREAAGYPYRPAFANDAGVSVRSIVKLEQGEPVGPSIYEAAARVLPGWTEETPRRVLEGEEPPPISERPMQEPPTEAGPGGLSDEERALIRLLSRRGWPAEDIAEALDELRRSNAPLPRVEQRYGTDR